MYQFGLFLLYFWYMLYNEKITNRENVVSYIGDSSSARKTIVPRSL